jgi:hypothetical protein
MGIQNPKLWLRKTTGLLIMVVIVQEVIMEK